MKSILLLIYVVSHAITSCAFSSISAKSSIRTDVFLRAANNDDDNIEIEKVDIAIMGAGIGGLCAGAILNTLYNKKVGIYESHYLPGEEVSFIVHIICSNFICTNFILIPSYVSLFRRMCTRL